MGMSLDDILCIFILFIFVTSISSLAFYQFYIQNQNINIVGSIECKERGYSGLTDYHYSESSNVLLLECDGVVDNRLKLFKVERCEHDKWGDEINCKDVWI